MFVLVCFWCTTNNQENISLAYINKHFFLAHGSADWQRQRCSSLSVKCRSSPCVYLWGPGQLSGFGSMEHVFLMVEGGCSQEASRNVMSRKAPRKSHPVTSIHFPLAQASFMAKANFSKEYPSHGGREGKNGNMCWKMFHSTAVFNSWLSCNSKSSFYKSVI